MVAVWDRLKPRRLSTARKQLAWISASHRVWVHGEEVEKAFHAEGTACEKHGGENVGAWETGTSPRSREHRWDGEEAEEGVVSDLSFRACSGPRI